jgi:hypothetical protein
MKAARLYAAAVTRSGCTVAQTAVEVAALPAKPISAGLDAATASPPEADEKRGRGLRNAAEERAPLARLMAERCRNGRPGPGDMCPLKPR